MIGQSVHELTRRAAGLFAESEHPVALTGAGISTASGIPDFRSEKSGVWENVDPVEVASLAAFRYQPQKFYDWFHPLAMAILTAEPNPAHEALARLEQAEQLDCVVTQNVDGLHQRAGSRTVCELHGHLRAASCISCLRRVSTENRLTEYLETGEAPLCDHCGGYLKPEVVLFGEQLPFDAVSQAGSYFADADLVLIGGSSLEVSPAAQLPYHAVEAGARLIIVNMDPTYLDTRADVVIHANVADVLPSLADEVLSVT